MKKLPISVGVLTWNSPETLFKTLKSYKENGLLEVVDEAIILCQEITDQDIEVANHFSLPYIGLKENVGIGMGLLNLAKSTKSQYFLPLENDWKLVENKEITYSRLYSGINLISKGYSMVRYRHRQNPGYPLFTYNPYYNNELNHYDKVIDLKSPHLLDSVHWCNPSQKFNDKINQEGEYFTTTSRWGNWTNNPSLFDRKFYIDYTSKFIIDENSPNPYNTDIGKITSEGEISYFWSRQDYKVAHGEGLFKHEDLKKFGK